MDSLLEFLLQFHSGWRYLVLLTTVLTMLYFAYALATGRTSPKQEGLILRIWPRFIDIQVTLGILLALLFIIEDRWYSALIGHIVLGLLASVLVNVPAIYKRLNGDPNDTVRRIMGVAVPLATLILIVIGILSIRDGIFEMTNT
jgi:hypothetical protein